MKTKTVFEAILTYGHDEDFQPSANESFRPTSCIPGSQGKVDVLHERVARGFPLWHPEDRIDFSGICGSKVKPRNV